jgi:hypothetical protein
MQAFSPKACKFKRGHHFSLAFAPHALGTPAVPQEPIQAKIEEVEQLPRLLETGQPARLAISVARKLRITPGC